MYSFPAPTLLTPPPNLSIRLTVTVAMEISNVAPRKLIRLDQNPSPLPSLGNAAGTAKADDDSIYG